MLRKEFKNLTPDKDWKKSLGDDLFVKAEKQLADNKGESIFEAFKSYFAFHHLAKAVAVASLVISIVTGGSIFTVSAAKDSLPGDTLYSVKRATEKVQDITTSRPEAKVKLKLNFAKERLDEARKIAKEQAQETDSREKIDQAMVDFQNEIAQAQTYLDEIKDSGDKIDEEILAELSYYEPEAKEGGSDEVKLSQEEAEDGNEEEVELAQAESEEVKDEQGNTIGLEVTEGKKAENGESEKADLAQEADKENKAEEVIKEDEIAKLTSALPEDLASELYLKTKEYQQIFDELRENEIIDEDGSEIDRAVAAVAELVESDIDSQENEKDIEAEEKERQGEIVEGDEVEQQEAVEELPQEETEQDDKTEESQKEENNQDNKVEEEIVAPKPEPKELIIREDEMEVRIEVE